MSDVELLQSAVVDDMPPRRVPTPLEDAGQFYDIWNLRTPPRHLNEAAIRALCRNAYLGGDLSVCRVLGRYRMFIDTNDVGLSTFLLLDGYWEMWTTEAMLQFIRQGMTVIDVGANLGYFTMLMADLTGPSGKVLAIEPNPQMASRLRRSAFVNGFGTNTAIHEIAVGDHDGTIGLAIPDGEPKNAHLSATGTGLSVPIRRLDSLPDATDADVIKIDVEGGEEGVWRGMAGILARNRPLTVLLEFTPGRYADAAAFLDTILASGFSLMKVDYTAGVISTTREAVLAGHPAEDQMLVLIR